MNKLLNLNQGCLGPYWSYLAYIPKTGYFHDKTKIFKGKSSSALFNDKNVVESNAP